MILIIKKYVIAGRIDWTNPKEPIWVYPCTSAEFSFTGKYLKIFLRNKNEYWQNYLGCILDGGSPVIIWIIRKRMKPEIRVPENENGEHHVLFFKRQDSCHEMHILGFEIEDGAKYWNFRMHRQEKLKFTEILYQQEKRDSSGLYRKVGSRNIREVILTAGIPYAWMTARMLNAQIHDIAQGGIALMDGQGWFHEPDQIGNGKCLE